MAMNNTLAVSYTADVYSRFTPYIYHIIVGVIVLILITFFLHWLESKYIPHMLKKKKLRGKRT